MDLLHFDVICKRSPSSQRAWIEILFTPLSLVLVPVALLAEGVDRNILGTIFFG